MSQNRELNRIAWSRIWWKCGLTLLLIMLAPGDWSLYSVVEAATITVDADCTLAEAILAANSDNIDDSPGCTAGDGADVINISAAGTTDDTITLSAPLPRIFSEIVINGNGYTISGNGQHRIFQIYTNLTLNRVTLKDAFIGNDGGGAIYARPSSIVNLRDSKIVDNSAFLGGAGIFGGNAIITVERTLFMNNVATSTGSDTGGGAVLYSAGTSPEAFLDIRQSAFISNSGQEGGAIRSIGSGPTIRIENSTFYGNTSAVEGGAIYITGTATLRHVTIAHNTSVANSSGSQLYHIPDTSQTSVFNSIIHGNDSVDDCSLSGTSVINSILVGDGSCSATLQGDPLLGDLVDGRYLPLLSGSPAINAANATECNNLHAQQDQRGQSRPYGSACDIGAIESMTSSSSQTGDSSRQVVAASTPVNTVDLLPPTVTVRVLDQTSGAAPQTQILSMDGIGNQDIINAGYLYAIDIWSYLGTGVEVCFDGNGTIILLDTSTSPRVIVPLESTASDGQTCATVTVVGQVILMTEEAADSVVPTEITQLTGCMVTTTHVLNFRESPGGTVIGYVPASASLTALERSPGWFMVDNIGAQGWISAEYVTLQGTCG